MILRIDKYAVDELDNRLWFYIAEPSLFTTATTFKAQIGDPSAVWFGWVQIISPDGQGWVDSPITGNTILVPKINPSSAYPGLPLYIQDIRDCLKNINLQYSAFNLPNNTGNWNSGANLQIFNFLPLSITSICRSNINNIWGLGYYDLSLYPSTYGYHMGIDFFAIDGAAVYSVGNAGIIVGIGENRVWGATPTQVYYTQRISNASWGAAYVNNSENATWGYTIIVRYDHFYVLYGHIKQIDLSVYVGKQVEAGERLGWMGTVDSPHLHIEARIINGNSQFYAVPSNPFITPMSTKTQFPNKFGVLKLDGNSPANVYDISQLFQASTSAYKSDFGEERENITGLGPSVQHGSIINFNSCQRTYLGPQSNNATPLLTSTEGIRGFQMPNPRAAADDPLFTATVPSFYPTWTPTANFSVPVPVQPQAVHKSR